MEAVLEAQNASAYIVAHASTSQRGTRSRVLGTSVELA